MVNRPKAIGTATETAIVRYARQSGFPAAERRALAGSADVGDILLCPGVIVEVKGGKAAETASDTQVSAWLDETERERAAARATVGLLVTKRKGHGLANPQGWWAHWRLGDLAALRGYPTDLTVADTAPVRMTLASALAQLRAAGFATWEPLP